LILTFISNRKKSHFVLFNLAHCISTAWYNLKKSLFLGKSQPQDPCKANLLNAMKQEKRTVYVDVGGKKT